MAARTPAYIRHVTLTTGHVRDSPRSEVSDAVVALAAELISAAVDSPETTLVPIPGFNGYRVGGRATSKCLVLTVHHVDDLAAVVATIGVATHSRCGARLWRDLHGWGTLPVVTDPGRCPPEPWVAAALEAAITDHPDAAGWLGDFERCVGWAFLGRR